MMRDCPPPGDLPIAPEIASAFGIAQALWPSAVEPGSRGVQYAWGHALKPYSHGEVCRAFEELARDHPKFPPLAEVLLTCEEQRQRARRDQAEREAASRPKLVPSSTTRDPLREGFRRWRDDKLEELRARARAESWDKECMRHCEVAVNARGYELFGSVRGVFTAPDEGRPAIPTRPHRRSP